MSSIYKMFLVFLLTIASSAVMAEEKPIVTIHDRDFFVVSVKGLDLSLPAKVRETVRRSVENTTAHAGTGMFGVQYTALNEMGEVELKHIDVDIQTTAYKCDAGVRLTNLKQTYGEKMDDPAKSIVISERTNDEFEGYVFHAEDHRHSDRNILIGASNKKNGDCYVTSLAVFGAGAMKAPVVKRVVKNITTAIEESYDSLAGTNTN